MAVTLYQRTKVINRITIINGKKEEEPAPTVSPKRELQEKIRGKMYGRRTIERR